MPLSTSSALARRLRDAQRLETLFGGFEPLPPGMPRDEAAMATRARQGRTAMLGARTRQAEQDALRQLTDILAKQAEFPGRAPGGSGLTGVGSMDLAGYEDVLAEQREQAELEAALMRQAPVSVRSAPLNEVHEPAFMPSQRQEQMPTESPAWQMPTVDQYRTELSALSDEELAQAVQSAGLPPNLFARRRR